jgi:hypothetical protein
VIQDPAWIRQLVVHRLAEPAIERIRHNYAIVWREMVEVHAATQFGVVVLVFARDSQEEGPLIRDICADVRSDQLFLGRATIIDEWVREKVSLLQYPALPLVKAALDWADKRNAPRRCYGPWKRPDICWAFDHGPQPSLRDLPPLGPFKWRSLVES